MVSLAESDCLALFESRIISEFKTWTGETEHIGCRAFFAFLWCHINVSTRLHLWSKNKPAPLHWGTKQQSVLSAVAKAVLSLHYTRRGCYSPLDSLTRVVCAKNVIKRWVINLMLVAQRQNKTALISDCLCAQRSERWERVCLCVQVYYPPFSLLMTNV